MTDEKQIEEMAKDITEIEFPENHPNVAVANEFEALIEAKALYEKGYRKLPENAVVLTNEEQYKILKATERRISQLKTQLAQARKETAREILKELYMYVSSDYLCGLRNPYKNNSYMGLVERLAKQYGVEVEE